jgi:hypothetical protein
VLYKKSISLEDGNNLIALCSLIESSEKSSLGTKSASIVSILLEGWFTLIVLFADPKISHQSPMTSSIWFSKE